MKINLIYICQYYGSSEVLGFSTREWFLNLEKNINPDTSCVLCLRGETFANNGISIYRFGTSNRLVSLMNLFNLLYRQFSFKHRNIVFIYQGGWYSLFISFFRLFLKLDIYQWKAHSVVDFKTKISILFFNKVTFTSKNSLYPLLYHKNLIELGQLVNRNIFNSFIDFSFRKSAFIIVGRPAAIKNYEFSIELFLSFLKNYDSSLFIYGSPLDVHELSHYNKLKSKYASYTGIIEFCGAIDRNSLVSKYNNSKYYLFHSSGAIDRSLFEAISCGCLPISNNKYFLETLDSRISSLIDVKTAFDFLKFITFQNELLLYFKSYIENYDLGLGIRKMSSIIIKND